MRPAISVAVGTALVGAVVDGAADLGPSLVQDRSPTAIVANASAEIRRTCAPFTDGNLPARPGAIRAGDGMLADVEGQHP